MGSRSSAVRCTAGRRSRPPKHTRRRSGQPNVFSDIGDGKCAGTLLSGERGNHSDVVDYLQPALQRAVLGSSEAFVPDWHMALQLGWIAPQFDGRYSVTEWTAEAMGQRLIHLQMIGVEAELP